MYPRVLHRGPVTAREVRVVHSAEDEAAASEAGWSRTPSSWADVDDSAQEASADGVDEQAEDADVVPVKKLKSKKAK